MDSLLSPFYHCVCLKRTPSKVFSISTVKHEIPKQDLISSLPTDLAEKILKLLPLRSAAWMGVLSKKWRQNWLCHSYLVFNAEFWEEQRTTNGCISCQTINNIINSILFHHNGPIHTFHLLIRHDIVQMMDFNLSQWLSFLSKHDIKQMILVNRKGYCLPLPSTIYTCKNMVELSIDNCILMPPPSCFEGFARLQSLELFYIEFRHDSLRRLLSSCPRLSELKLIVKRSDTHDNLVIDVPSVERLSVEVLEGVFFEKISIKNALRLKSISLVLYQSELGISAAKTADIASLLNKNSPGLQNLHLGGDLCQLLGAYAVTEQSSPAFSHLHTLSLANLDMGDSGVIRFLVGLIQSCPVVKHLKISVSLWRSIDQHQFNYNNNINYTFGHLRKVEINYIKGSTSELKFIEFILANSTALECLFFCCIGVDPSSEIKVLQQLLQLPRASTNAKLIYLEK